MDPRLKDLQRLAELIRAREDARLSRISAKRAKLEQEINSLRTALPDPDPRDGFTRLGGWERARLWHDIRIMECNRDLAKERAAQLEQAPKAARARARCEVLAEMIKRSK